jgi:S-(hydroxymethyl)glutathione dehydrogenase/alcohol dehydrogenase
MKAAIWDGSGLTVRGDVEVREPGPDEVLVRVERSGVCHTDLSMMTALAWAPVVLGHEAAGEIAKLGSGIEGWSVGDRVAVGTQAPCGSCRECLRGQPHNCDTNWGFVPAHPFTIAGAPIASFANVSSFAQEIVVKASQVFAARDLPASQAALIGCAVSTGVCAARRLGKVGPGDTVAVFGVGGIGVNAIQGARGSGARVIAVDANPAKEAAARLFGAAEFMLAAPGIGSRAAAAFLKQAHGPIDVALECSGAVSAIETAMGCVKRGGRTVLIGMARPGAEVSLSLASFVTGGEIAATMNGGAVPESDYPELIAQALDGRLNLADQISGLWPLERIHEAIAALKAGEVTRAVLDMT